MLKYCSIILFLFMFGASAAVAKNELKRDQYLFAFEELFKEKKFKEATKYINYLQEGSYNIDDEYYFQFGLNYYELCDLSKADALFDLYYQKAGRYGKSYKQLLKMKNNIENKVHTKKCARQIRSEFESKPRYIKVINSCEHEIKFAISYTNTDSKLKRIGWWTYKPGHGRKTVLSDGKNRLKATSTNFAISFDRSQFARYVQMNKYHRSPLVIKVGTKHHDFYSADFKVDGNILVHEISCSKDQQRVTDAKKYGYKLLVVNECRRKSVFFVAAFKRFSNKKFTIFGNKNVDGEITRRIIVQSGREKLYTHHYNKYSERNEPYRLDGEYFYMNASFSGSSKAINRSDKRLRFEDLSGDKEYLSFEKRYANPVFYKHNLVSRIILDCP